LCKRLVSPVDWVHNLLDINDTKQQGGRSFSSRGVVLVLVVALADFAWSMFDGRSVAESLISAILGLVGTGWYLLAMCASSHNNPDDPNEPARWVP
jgi:hypothetical protein